MMTANIHPIELEDLKSIKGLSTKCFTYDKDNKIFSIEMSELAFVDSKDFFINGKLCRSNGKMNINTSNSHGSLVLKSHRTGIRAFFTFDSEDKDNDNEVQGIYYKYFAADNDPQGKNPNLRTCKVLAIND